MSAGFPSGSRSPILPGATIGFLGGGQLGRMTALAARSMGYDIQVLDPEAACATRPVASRTITAKFDDVNAAVDLASQCDVITLEIEQIHPDVLDAVAARTTLHPGREAVYIIQDRIRQKQWLKANDFPLGAFVAAQSADDIADAVRTHGPCIAKSTHGGYDGRGQVRLSNVDQAKDAWTALGGHPCVVEQRIDIAYEISVLVARSASGQVAVYPPSRNHHTSGILTWAVVPAVISDAMTQRAQHLARGVAERIGIVGLLAVECFVTKDNTLLVNELAPRPHNTYHHSERGLATSQFEQLVRAVCDLPLGDTTAFAPSAIVNLLGDVWVQDTPPAMEHALEVDGVRLHLYGKAGARAGRKMGHLSAIGTSAQDALGRVLESYRRLSPATTGSFDVHEPVLAHITS
ncbi:phosphoribosylaminoimidazole carboxylase ATPase subunit [Gemmatimonas aurantiaca T-27]|uniref:N5-carboxyaminoimidazole ribonucleotide synthase n=2 Tax=Gemmatimonas aurantiaca TaxID=173480 RepID=C1A9T4_GEMAT|nr:5-(carboxyamino)imidazole ribonucleotide synthase [Gemmatimonas aurantiaca]BAH39261.1 phosphoribosylaminoimidazole carboxylase ATPase subunit [Gemmatimonas aurantiaca T-27]